jgi:PAS domain S-box-containing protein
MLEKRAAQLALLTEIGRQVASVLAVDQVLQRAAQLTQQLFGYQHVAVFICEAGMVTMQAEAGEFHSLFPPDHRLAFGQGMVGWVALNGRTLLSNDVDREPRYVNLYPDRLFTRSELSVPVKLGNQILGVLDIQSTTCDAFDENDAVVMETLAGQIAVALENARLYTSLQQELDERKRAEQALRAERDRAQRYLDTARVILVALNVQGEITLLNRSGYQILGYDEGELLGCNWFDTCLPAAIRAEVKAVFLQIMRGEIDSAEYYENSVETSDGRQRLIAWYNTLLRDEDGAIIGTLSSGEDITERKRAEDETRRRAGELEALVNVSYAIRTARSRADIPAAILIQLLTLFKADGAALLDQDAVTGEVVVRAAAGAWSERQDARFQLDAWGQMTSPLLEWPQIHNHAQALAQHLRSERMPNIQALAGAPLIADQERIGALWIGRQIDFGEADLRLLTAIGDIVANALHRAALLEDLAVQLEMLQKTQARLVQSEKLAGIGQLVAGVAHELNNPLTSVILYAQILQMRAADPSLHKEIERIVSEAQRASKIVRGLLEFARQRPAERKPVQINHVLTATLELLAYELRTHNIQVETGYDPRLPLTLADPYQLQQVFVNITTNAWQAMRDQGQGTLRMITQFGPPLFSPMAPGARPVIRILFCDSGPGLSSEGLLHSFDPFFTTKPAGQGTGLGLSICHGIISEHGGHIWAESEPGQGACFIIELPWVIPDQPDVPAASLPISHAVTTGKRILLIDDESSMLTAVKSILEKAGYGVGAVSHAANALQQLEQTAYDLVLCDIRMPEMSGVEFYRALQQSQPAMSRRILFVTGDAASPTTRQFLESTGVPFLSKPFELNELLERVGKIVQLLPPRQADVVEQLEN